MTWAIEGNVAVGKTTLLKGLERHGYSISLEPVANWIPFLDRYYKDSSNGFALQTKIMTDLTLGVDLTNVDFQERCAWTQPSTFIKVMHQGGLLSKEEKQLLIQLNTHLCTKPDGIIYLRCSPEECMRRVKKRSRDCETTVQLEYLEQLHEAYDDLLLDNLEVPVVVLDVTCMDADEVLRLMLEYVRAHRSSMS
jgi:deoxyadenosine/deoxycytidine kinase